MKTISQTIVFAVVIISSVTEARPKQHSTHGHRGDNSKILITFESIKFNSISNCFR